jgi:outer membrane protein
MKKTLAGILLGVSALLRVGCGGRNAEFGVVDMRQVDEKAPILKTVREEVTAKSLAVQEEIQKNTVGKPREEQEKFLEEKRAEMELLQAESQNKVKASLDAALAAVAKEKKLGAILIKEAVPQGGVDVTEDVVQKMQ